MVYKYEQKTITSQNKLYTRHNYTITKDKLHNSQKTNMDAAWIEVSKKKNWNNPEMSTPYKQPKINRYHLRKSVPTTNSIEGLEEELDDKNNIRMEKIAKPSLIFVARVNNFSLLLQFLKEIATDGHEIKIMNEQIKIQPKSSIAYVNIVKELKSKNMDFYTYKLKQEKSFKVVLKHIHATANVDDIKKEMKLKI